MPEIVCKRCGQTFSRPSSLRRHRAERRCPSPAKPALARSQAIRGEVLDVTPRFSWRESVPVPARAIQGGTRALAVRKPDREGLAFLQGQRRREALRRWSMEPRIEAVSEASLREQYWILRAMASKLDRGAGSPALRQQFEAALAEYIRNGETFATANPPRLPETRVLGLLGG